MVALATYERIDPSSIAAFSPVIVRDLLRKRLGFHGVVVSDSLTAEAVKAWTPRQRATYDNVVLLWWCAVAQALVAAVLPHLLVESLS